MKSLIACCILSLSAVMAAPEDYEKKILSGESGFIVCNGGGTNNPLFSKDCKSTMLVRVSGGGIKYEGTCVDSNGITYLLACDAINFEYTTSPTDGKKTK